MMDEIIAIRALVTCRRCKGIGREGRPNENPCANCQGAGVVQCWVPVEELRSAMGLLRTPIDDTAWEPT